MESETAPLRNQGVMFVWLLPSTLLPTRKVTEAHSAAASVSMFRVHFIMRDGQQDLGVDEVAEEEVPMQCSLQQCLS